MLFLVFSGTVFVCAQVRIGGNVAPHASAILDLNETDATNDGQLGLALPRVNLTAEADPLNGSTPKDGTLVFNTNVSLGTGLYYWLTDRWVKLPLGSDFTEQDSIVGNEVLNATTSRGLVRAGAGTSANPFTLGIADDGISSAMISSGAVTYTKLSVSGASSGQILKFDGTAWAPASGGLESATNGLTANGNAVKLGGTLAENTSIAQSGYNLYTSGSGKVGIGAAPTATSSKFEVNGAATNTDAYDAGSSTTIDFSFSNLAFTAASAGNTFTLNNLKSGGTYTLAVQGLAGGEASFLAFNTAGDPLDVPILNNEDVSAGNHALYTILVIGTTAYVFVNTGFN